MVDGSARLYKCIHIAQMLDPMSEPLKWEVVSGTNTSLSRADLTMAWEDNSDFKLLIAKSVASSAMSASVILPIENSSEITLF